MKNQNAVTLTNSRRRIVTKIIYYYYCDGCKEEFWDDEENSDCPHCGNSGLESEYKEEIDDAK